MPSAARGRPSNPTPGVPALPPYEQPGHPLDEKAEHALQDLRRNHKLESLKNRQQAANNHLTEAAADINERLYVKLENYERAKRRQETMSSQRSEEIDDDAVDTMRQETESMTGRLDQRIREMIDARTEVVNTESALRELETNTVKNRRTLAPTQSTIDVTQMRTPNRSGVSGDSGDEEEEEEADSQARRPASLVDTLKERQAKAQAVYAESSLSERYAAHNDYIGFRKIVHDARHPGEEAPPLPHSSTWFSAEANGAQDRAFTGAVTDGHDEDEDFQIASEKVSIKCPLTLLPMVEPVQSIKCSHNFEKKAILDMIRHSDIGAPADGEHGENQPFVQCPVCEKHMTASDLRPNLVLLRKIKRAQAAELAQHEESDVDEGADESRMMNAHNITNSPPPKTRSFKNERTSQAAATRNRANLPTGATASGGQPDQIEVL